MTPVLRKTAAMVLLAFVVIPLALACYCIFRCDSSSVSLVDLRPPGLYPLGDDCTTDHTHGSSHLVELRYRIGMSRDAIQKNFAFGARLIASDSRPNKDWRAIGRSQSGLAYYILEFERGHQKGLVVACDVYDDGESHHVLFFDNEGMLVGAQQLPGFICLSASVDSANERPGADAGWRDLVAFGSARPRPAQAER